MDKFVIYQIRNVVNNKRYIGSTCNYIKREKDHKKYLKNNKHHSGRLQNSWNKYGVQNFVFEIVEIVENKENLLTREQYWIDYYKSYKDENGYNICKVAGSNLGKKASEETKRKLVISHASKLNWDKVKEMRKLYHEGIQLKELSKRYNISYSAVSNIVNNRNWFDSNYRLLTWEERQGGFHSNTVLTFEKAKEIRKLHANGMEQKQIANLFKIAKTTVTEIIRNRSWRDEEYRPPLEYDQIRKKCLLTLEQAEEIRKKYTENQYTIKALANEYNVKSRIICNIIYNRTYNKSQ